MVSERGVQRDWFGAKALAGRKLLRGKRISGESEPTSCCFHNLFAAVVGRAPTTKMPGTTKVSTISDVLALAHLGSKNLEPKLSLSELALLERLPLLKQLQAAGLSLPERQAFANALLKAKREGALHPQECAPAATLDVSDPAIASASASGKPSPPSGITCTALAPGEYCRIFVISDAHADHPANLEWIQTRLPARAANAFDVCLCAGDLSDTPDTLNQALHILKSRFHEVVFTAGNHELWMKPRPISLGGAPNTQTSLARLHQIHAECERMGVRTSPLWIVVPDKAARDLLVVPLSSWYHECFDTEPDLPSGADAGARGDGDDEASSFRGMWTDYHLCKWPEGTVHGSRKLAETIASFNEPYLARLIPALRASRSNGRPQPPVRLSKTETYALYEQAPYQVGPLWSSVDAPTFFTERRSTRPTQTPTHETLTPCNGTDDASTDDVRADVGDAHRPFIVSLSHMVPRQELVPEKRMLLQPSLHKVCGSHPLEEQIRRLMPDVHAFGHTHLNIDLTCDGIRYVQWPLGTPREQRAQTRVSSFGLMCVYDGAKGGETPQHWTHWGRHYEEYERDLSKVARPPYVLQVQNSLSGAEKAARSTWAHEQALQHAAGASSVGTSEITHRSRPSAR